MGNRHNYSKHYSQENVDNFPETVEAIDTSEVVEEIEKVKPLMGEVFVEKLNLRSTPSSDNNNNIVKELHKGDLMEIIQNMGNWSQVCTAAGIDGYVMSEYIKIHE